MSVREHWDMCCPNCESSHQLDVSALIWLRLVEDGTELEEAEEHATEWDNASVCCCRCCGWSGTVKDARCSDEGTRPIWRPLNKPVEIVEKKASSDDRPPDELGATRNIEEFFREPPRWFLIGLVSVLGVVVLFRVLNLGWGIVEWILSYPYFVN